jgi:predicted anti-sigma-YlaC factor YlaD
MINNIPCEIIQDLMPLYVDELTSELSNAEIEIHLDECEHCKEKYISMKTSVGYAKSEKNNRNEKEINYLKKINLYQKRNLILGSIISFLLGITIPILMLMIPIMTTLLNGGEIPAYQIERFNMVWYIVVIEIVVSGLFVCALYLGFNFLFKKLKNK